jgi:hypothetical protein
MGVKKSARTKTPGSRSAAKTGAKTADPKPAEAEPVPASPRMGMTKMVAAGVGLIAIAIVAGIVMFGGRDSAERAEASAVAAQVDSPDVQPKASRPVRAIAGVPGKKTAPKPRAAEAAGAAVAPRTASELPDAVMIEGCLEQSGEAFRLKDTKGDNAPKSRSWKSGFLKKGARPVDVVDWNNRLKDHVGERISVSGMFVDGEMHVRSLRRVSTSCN